MKAAEKLARELIPYIAGCRWDQASSKERIRAEDTAIYVLRRERAAVRRARGRTLGWVILRSECDESGMDCWWEIDGGMLDEPVNARMTRLMGKEVARVVAVPKPKRKVPRG